MQETFQQPLPTLTRQRTRSAPALAYVALGARSDPALLLLHGVGSASDTWTDLVPLLPAGYRVVAPDYRGHGLSDVPVGPYDVDDFVGDVVRLLDELTIPAAHIVGFSLGALIAQATALAHPERVLSLVLLNSIASRTPEEEARALDRLEFIRATHPIESSIASAARWFTPAFLNEHPERVARETELVARVDHPGYAASYEVLATTDLGEAPAAIRVPTLIVTGECDQGSTPAMSAHLASLIPNARLEIRPGLKHYLHVEDAPTIATLIAGFLADHRSSTAPPR